MSSHQVLYTPVKLGAHTVGNRVALAPLTRGRASETHVPAAYAATYYAQRSDPATGAGLVIGEATGICQRGTGWFRAPGLWKAEQVEAWKPIIKAVHDKGSLFAMQLWHMGRQGHSEVLSAPPLSASAIAPPGQVTGAHGKKHDFETPEAMSAAQIDETVAAYATAARNAVQAGADFVELHGANGYLIDQFTQSKTNQRTDENGGSIEHRLRFVKRVTRATIDAAGGPGRVGIRLSPNGLYGDMDSADNLETFDALIEWLGEQRIAFVHLMDKVFGQPSENPLHDVYTLARARDVIAKTAGADGTTRLIGNVDYTRDTAAERINAGEADLIAFGRPFIANPDLVWLFKNDKTDAIVDADYPSWWQHDKHEDGYTDWPTFAERTK